MDIFISKINSLYSNKKVVSCLRLVYRGYIYTLSILGNILFLSREIITYGALIAYSSSILITNSFKVLILLLLYKSNSITIKVDNSAIKF